MIYLQKSFVHCIKKKTFFLKVKKCYNILSIKEQPLKKNRNILLVQRDYKLNKKENVLCEFKIDNVKKIQFYNLFNFNLIDVLIIFKFLMQLKKIILYKYDNSISIKIKRQMIEKNYKYHVDWYNNINLLDDFIDFLNKYLLKKKDYKILFKKYIDDELNRKKKKKNNIIYNTLSRNNNNDNIITKEKRKKKKIYKYLKRCVLKRIIKNISINIRNKNYTNNKNDKSFLINFYINDNHFCISSFYKKIKGIYYTYRSVVYYKENYIKKVVAIINLISYNKSYYEIKKNYIIINSFYIKYYVKNILNKFFSLHEEFLKKKFKGLKKNFIYVSPIRKYVNNYCEKIQMNYLEKNIENNNTINTNIYRSFNNIIKIKTMTIYLNGKYFKSFPIILIYNINNNNFYLNNFFYFNIAKYDINNLCILKEIYLNNLTSFQNNKFYYIDDQNIILNNDNINIDINYIYLFYFLYFNEENLFLPDKINPTFCFYSLTNRKKKNSKIIKKIIYKSDKNFINFVF
ncbi:conserved Plasmodium protein, unknown function [Plasmodium gallinaceum]|uniref:Uncharacterized protein n=1 Tax=Plasmodium gallinaceum TaxID=5849 RepID=A0A1J1GRF3_PLAGA|nr:conserved Plasmodium protein, unknown function [Plasmodium gallinaceum]CRG93864.1 conserved Plasmodium protein, unknown function [Plasmodium gallinaceum]